MLFLKLFPRFTTQLLKDMLFSERNNINSIMDCQSQKIRYQSYTIPFDVQLFQSLCPKYTKSIVFVTIIKPFFKMQLAHQYSSLLIHVQFLGILGASLLHDAVNFVLDAEQGLVLDQVCRTWIFSSEDVDSRASVGILQGLPQVKAVMMATKHTNVSTLDVPRSDEELRRPHLVIKFSSQCSAVFILGLGRANFELQTKSVVSSKLARSNKDYFFYVGSTQEKDQFLKSPIEVDIRNKYFVTLSNSGVSSIQDTCTTLDPMKRPLFIHTCDHGVLNGRLIRFSTSVELYLTFWSVGNKQYGKGVNFKIISEAARFYNYTFFLRYASDGRSTGYYRNGRWYGAVGDVFRRVNDVAVSLGIADDRDTVVDNGIPFFLSTFVFFIKTPPLQTDWKAIGNSFDSFVWSMVILSIFATMLTNYALVRFKPKNESNSVHISFVEIALSVLCILIEQAANRKSWTTARVRILIVCLLIYGEIVGTAYQSKLISAMTFITPEKIPLTHTELVEQNYKILFRYYGGIAYVQALASKNPIEKTIFRRATLVNSSEDCIVSAILTEKTVCLDWTMHGLYSTHKNATVHVSQTKSLMIMSKDYTYACLMGWFHRMNSPFRESFDRYIIWTYASGLFRKWFTEHSENTKRDGARWVNSQKDSLVNRRILESYEENMDTGPKPLFMRSFYGVIGILIVGLAISTITFLVETPSGKIPALKYKKKLMAVFAFKHTLGNVRL